MQYQFFPPLSNEEYALLKASIAKSGINTPVDIDEHGNILDGHHRIRAWNELRSEGVNVADYPRLVRAGLSEDQKIEFTIDGNAARRHLTGEQRAEVALALRERGWSYPRIAAQMGAAVGTVYADIHSTFQNRKVDLPERVIGSDGKSRPATMPRRPEEDEPIFNIQPGPRGIMNAVPNPGAAIEPALETSQIEAPATMPASRLAVHFSSETPEHYTPAVIIEAAVKCLGAIDLDPCSNSHDTPNVPAAAHYTAEDDGLGHEWRGTVYMNPPYGREIGAWVEKLCLEHEAGRVTAAIALVPARTDTQWFDRLADYPWCAVRGRLTFIGNDDPAPFPSAIFYLGEEIGTFYRAFCDLGRIWQTIIPDNDGVCWSGRFAE